MKTSLRPDQLGHYVTQQLNHFFPDEKAVQSGDVMLALPLALDRLDFCFRHAVLKHYFDGSNSIFNHLFSDQYASFLWFLANTIWQTTGRTPLLDKLFCLNKALHGIECMYDTRLPEVFFFSHTVGCVLGKATYGNYLVFSQGCTVGTHRGQYPVIEDGVALAAYASVIGRCVIGTRASVGSNTAVFQRDIPPDTVVFRNEQGALVMRVAERAYAQQFINASFFARR